MGRKILSQVLVGNDMIVPVRAALAAPAAQIMKPVMEAVPLSFENVPQRPKRRLLHGTVELFHRYSLGVSALLLLMIGAASIQLGAAYKSAHIKLLPSSSVALRTPVQPLRGPNTVVPSAQAEAYLQRITSQPFSLMTGEKAVAVGADMIRSWLKIVPRPDQGVTYITVNKAAVVKSLNDLAQPYVKAPVNQVSITRADGTSEVIAAGRNGTQLGDINPLVQQLSNKLLPAKGQQLTLPVETLAFATVTPDAFDKMIEVDVTAKQMYLYEKGRLVNSYPISAGAPETPTVLGQFKILSKLRIQDMRGFNTDGSRYFQPNVRWVSYFAPGGYAIHGNYWRPSSWFGRINSSHGCVGLPEAQAKEVYDWAPAGTAVIVHA